MDKLTKQKKTTDMRCFYLTPGDVLKGRVEPIIWMRTCEWLSRLGYNVTLVSTYYYRKENIPRHQIFEHFGIEPLFTITILPTLLSLNFSRVIWSRMNLLIVYFCYLLPILISDDKKVFFSKGQACMQVVCFIEKILGRKVTKIFELHSIGDNVRLVKMLGKMDTIIVNSKIVRQRLIEKGIDENKILIAYNAPFAQGKPVSIREAREQLGFDQKTKILLYAGKLYEENVKLFIMLARHIKLSEYQLHIVGGNPLILEFSEKMKNEYDVKNIIFHGFQSPSKVGVYLSASDLVFCSYSNNLPNIEQATPAKYFDYMYMERPFLCSENTAILELLKDKENCIYFEPENINDLADKLHKYGGDEQLLLQMVENNRSLIKKLCWPKRMKVIVKKMDQLTE